jgi:hypothetical protein
MKESSGQYHLPSAILERAVSGINLVNSGQYHLLSIISENDSVRYQSNRWICLDDVGITYIQVL